MRTCQKIIFLLFLLLSGNIISAQKLNFNYLTVKNGLPQNTVSSVIKDKYGFMWFGTWNGLCRYDGYSFKVYNTIPGDSSSLTNNRIHHLYKDKNGTLWITTFNSFVCRYNYQTDNFTRFTQAQLSKSLIDSTNRRRNLTKLNALSGLFRLQIGSFKVVGENEHIVFQTKTNLQGGLSDNHIYSAYKAKDGLLWLGSVNGGINWTDLNAKQFNKFTVALGGENGGKTAVSAILAEENGIWLGTPDKGLLYTNHHGKIIKRFDVGLAGNSIRSIFKDSNHDLWIGYRAGLDKYDPKAKQFTTYFHDRPTSPASSRRFSAIAEDPIDRSLWFGTSTGLLRRKREGNSFEKQDLKNYFDNTSVVSIFFDSKANLWIGTSYNGIILVKRDAKTKVWTDTITFTAKGTHPQLPDQRVYSIVEDKFGNIWTGTTNGLCRINLKTGKLSTYTKEQGLVDQYIAKLVPDHHGNLWISHKKGLSKLKISTGEIRNYSINKNTLGYEGLDGSGYFDTNTEKIYFGAVDGYVSFLPKQIFDNPSLPVTTLTELQVLNKPVGVQQKINDRVILSQPLHLTKEITLTNSDRSFSIEFSALHYAEPEKNQYAYMLEGFDKDWIHTDATKRLATYANLAAGKYIFKVKASNSDGVWNKTPATLQILVLPPWWKMWWAYLFYISIIIGLIYLIYRYISNKHQYNQKILKEQLKNEKAQELDRLKSSFFTHVSHEFRTPLTLIIDPLDTLIGGNLPLDKRMDYYTVMQRNARRLLRLINQFLDFRKLESGKLELRVIHQDVVLFIRNTLSAFELLAQQRNISFIFKTSVNELLFNFDADVVDKILFNLISNAFKFTPDGGTISVDLNTSADQKIVIQVCDNGTGIPAHAQEKIFDPFYQANSADRDAKGGTGIGLSLTKELTLLHKGEISVTSEANLKTCFTISLANLEEPTTLISLRENEFSNPGEYLDDNLVLKDKQVDTSKPLVLVVEDNNDVRNYLSINLEKEYQVITSANGTDGLQQALSTIPDLVISDVMMPGLNGIELCKKLKTDEKTSHIPIILLTAKQSDEAQTQGYETGADAYIGKPFNSTLLLVRIKNLIDSRKKLRELFNKSTGFNTRIVASNPSDQAFMERATKLIEQHMANEEFNVEWMASQLFLSRTQLYRKIKALTDQSVHDFITTIRLNRGAELLLQNQLPVAEIAYLVGYADSTSFSRSFQKQFGETPKRYGK